MNIQQIQQSKKVYNSMMNACDYCNCEEQFREEVESHAHDNLFGTIMAVAEIKQCSVDEAKLYVRSCMDQFA